MLNKLVLAPEAIDDLDLIWNYIAQDNPEAADRVVEAVYRTCGLLAERAEIGRLLRFPSPALAGVRSIVITDFPNYLVFYRLRESEVQILRVLHGARDVEAIFNAS